MNLIVEKVFLLVGMLATTLAVAAITIYVVRSRSRSQVNRTEWNKRLTIASCFAGGVFLTACLLDLLPDVWESFGKACETIKADYKIKITYPIASLVVLVGFILVLIVEELARYIQSVSARKITIPNERSPLLAESRIRVEFPNGDTNGGSQDDILETGIPRRTSVSSDNSSGSPSVQESSSSTFDVFLDSKFKGILLFIALSFHSLFEGLAIGLQTSLEQLLQLFLAVACHKAVMALSLALTLAQSTLSISGLIITNTLFALSSPIGIGIGIGLSNLDTLAGNLVKAILQGIACGTFLYVALFEVLFLELQKPTAKRRHKILAIILGCTLMAAIMVFAV